MCETYLDHLNSLQHNLKKGSIFSQKSKKNESAFIAVLRLASTFKYSKNYFIFIKSQLIALTIIINYI